MGKEKRIKSVPKSGQTVGDIVVGDKRTYKNSGQLYEKEKASILSEDKLDVLREEMLDSLDSPDTISKYRDLERLVKLAEDSSSQVEIILLRKEIIRIFETIIKSALYFATGFLIFIISQLFLSTKFGLFTNLPDYLSFNPLSIFILVGIHGLLFLLIIQLYSIEKKWNRIIEIDRGILSNLLDQIHTQKELTYSDLSNLKKEIIEMRLSRIKFNP